MRAAIEFAGMTVKPGEARTLELGIPELYTHSPITAPIYVHHSKRPGPVLFLSGAIHGDEINGVEIIRRIIKLKALKRLRGTLIAVPIVNILGFLNQTRYLPDRRDLNRSFPGSVKGSLAGRMANIFLQEVVAKCTHGIDLHTAAIHRDNFPQIRAVDDDEQIVRMSRAFNAPVIVNTPILEGTLRSAAQELGIPVIVYEAGEALRFNEVAIRAGVNGVLSVMRELEMLPAIRSRKKPIEPFVAKSSTWVRAPKSGILRAQKSLGERVESGEQLGMVSDPAGLSEECVTASVRGIIIGRTNLPLVHEGEALFHIARFENSASVLGVVEEFQQRLDPSSDSKPESDSPIV